MIFFAYVAVLFFVLSTFWRGSILSCQLSESGGCSSCPPANTSDPLECLQCLTCATFRESVILCPAAEFCSSLKGKLKRRCWPCCSVRWKVGSAFLVWLLISRSGIQPVLRFVATRTGIDLQSQKVCVGIPRVLVYMHCLFLVCRRRWRTGRTSSPNYGKNTLRLFCKWSRWRNGTRRRRTRDKLSCRAVASRAAPAMPPSTTPVKTSLKDTLTASFLFMLTNKTNLVILHWMEELFQVTSLCDAERLRLAGTATCKVVLPPSGQRALQRRQRGNSLRGFWIRCHIVEWLKYVFSG